MIKICDAVNKEISEDDCRDTSSSLIVDLFSMIIKILVCATLIQIFKVSKNLLTELNLCANITAPIKYKVPPQL